MNIVAIAAWFFIFMIIFWGITHIKLKKVNITSDDCPKEIKDVYFNKHPGAKWIIDMKNSFDRVSKHMKDFTVFLKDNKNVKSLTAIEIIMVLTMGQQILVNAYEKLAKMSIFKADHIINKHGIKAATEMYFGDYIEDFYYTAFIIDLFKDSIEKKKDFEISKETLVSCKERAHNIRLQYAA